MMTMSVALDAMVRPMLEHWSGMCAGKVLVVTLGN